MNISEFTKKDHDLREKRRKEDLERDSKGLGRDPPEAPEPGRAWKSTVPEKDVPLHDQRPWDERPIY